MMETLYISRPLLNATRLAAYADAIGLKNVLSPNDMHATIAYSRDPVNWSLSVFHPDLLTVIASGGRRTISRFGDAVVLEIESAVFSQRWAQLVLAGASWDHPEYRPHVTLAYDQDIDVTSIIAATAALTFGPERRMSLEVELEYIYHDQEKLNLSKENPR